MLEWRVFTDEEIARLEPRCRARHPRRYASCELPPDHVTGRNTAPRNEVWHLGRDNWGCWRSWPPRDRRLAMFRRKVRSKPLIQLSASMIEDCRRRGREHAARIAQYSEQASLYIS